MEKTVVVGILMKHLEGALAEIAAQVAFPALEKVVAESASKIDDVVLATLEEPLKKAVMDAITKLSNS